MDEENKKYWTDDDDLVSDYVLGRLSAEEKKRLDEEIADCEPCKQKIRVEMEIAAGIKRHGRDYLKGIMRKKLSRQRATQFYSYQYIGLAAAIVIIAIGIGLYQLWFSDLAAPKKFHQQEVVLVPQEDTSGGNLAELPDDGSLQEGGEVLDEKSGPPPEEKTERQDQKSEVTAGKSERRSETVAAAHEDPVPAMTEAESDAAHDGKIESSPTSSAIWLIGKVVMISEQTESRSAARTSGEIAKKEKRETEQAETQSKKNLKVRRAEDEGIVLQQKEIKNLPSDLKSRGDTMERDVQTLFERTETGVTLTLFGDAVSQEELNEAVIETMTDDSLVVSLPRHRIAFLLPPGWNSQPVRRQ